MRLSRVLYTTLLLGSFPFAAQAAPTHPLFSFGSFGSNPDQFTNPRGMALDDSGNVYVADRNLDRVSKWDSAGSLVKTWGTTGTALGQFDSPHAIAVDDENNVYVADMENDRIQKFDANGTFITFWAIDKPIEIEYHPDGFLYTYDSFNVAIEVTDKVGKFEFSYSPGSMIGAMAIDAWGAVYTIHFETINKIRKSTSYGNLIYQFGDEGTEPGEFIDPGALWTDENGNLWVGDPSLHRIQIFDSTGVFLTLFGKEGEELGQFKEPSDLERRPNGLLYVLETEIFRVQVLDASNFAPTVSVLEPTPAKFFTPGNLAAVAWEARDEKGVASVEISYVTNEELYGASTSGTVGASSSLNYIYPSDGGWFLLGDIGFDSVFAMDTDPLSGIIYAVGARPADSVWVLLTIDPATGAGTEIGPTCIEDRIEDLAFEPGTNRLLGHTRVIEAESYLVEFDRMTGRATVIGPTTEGGSSFTLENSRNGQLYSVIGFGGVSRLYKISPTTGQAFDPVVLSYPPGFVNNPFSVDMDRSALLPDPHVLFRDNSTSIRLGILRTETSPPLIELVGSTNGSLGAIAWHPGEETVIATGEPNDGVYLWTVPDAPTNAGRIKITAIDTDGAESFDYSDGYFFILNTTGGESVEKPTISLSEPVPNPTTGSTTIRFRTIARGRVDLGIYDIRGRWIRSLLSGALEPGDHALRWDGLDHAGRRAPSGHYLVKLETGGGVLTRGVSLTR